MLYISNDNKTVVIGSKLTEKLESPLNIELMKDESNIAPEGGGRDINYYRVNF